jgi:hypothetical protein
LASDSSGPSTRRPATGAGSSPQQLQTRNFTGEQAASCDRQLESPEGGMTCAAGPLKPSAKGSDPSEHTVSSYWCGTWSLTLRKEC